MVLEQPRVHALLQPEIMPGFRLDMGVSGKADQGGQVHERIVLHLQKIAPAHQLVHRPRAQLRHDLPQLLRHEDHEPLHVLRLADEPLAQFRVLRRHAEGTGAQLAHAHHAAAHGDQRRGGKAEFLRAQQQRNGHVVPGHQFAVSLQRHGLPEAVAAQHLMGLGQANLPGQARVMDAGHWRRAGAALAAGDQDAARPCLGHTAGDGAHTGGRHQLDRYFGIFIRTLQVINEFGQVFDGVDIVMGRRRNQRDSGRGAAGLRHALRHLRAGQMPSLTGLRALGHLDLYLLGAQQIVPGHAKAPGGYLLDGGIQLRAEALGQLAALATVAPAAKAVHGDSHALVGLLRYGAVGHRAGLEAPDNAPDRLNFINRHGLAHLVVEIQ